MCAPPTNAISTAAGTKMPAPGSLLLDVSASALPLSDGAGFVVVRPSTVVFGVAFADARAETDAVGPAEVVARTFGSVLCVWRGAGDWLLDVGGFPEPTTTVPVIVGWMEQ